jgi:biotin carboxyl carrier protein
MKMYKIKVNDKFEFEMTPTQIENVDILDLGEGAFHVLNNNQSYNAQIEHIDYASKTATVKVNGQSYTISIADQYDQLVERMGLSIASNQAADDVKAPMPGLVLDILVEAGQTIQKGDSLLILEAMKMENVLKATGDGTVKSVIVEKGNAVDKNQVLIELEG